MITFKQFLSESTPTPTPTPSNMDGAFTVGSVSFDNVKGLGATPNSQNVIYRGAVAWIKPSTFRKLALAADRSSDASKIEELMRDGKAIAAPWLDIDIVGEPSNPEMVKVTGHEGRARADAFKAINGDVYMPVQLQLSGIRARNLSPEFFNWIEKNGLVAERSSSTVHLNAKMYYWNYETVKV
jgi:hypothetical protein